MLKFCFISGLLTCADCVHFITLSYTHKVEHVSDLILCVIDAGSEYDTLLHMMEQDMCLRFDVMCCTVMCST